MNKYQKRIKKFTEERNWNQFHNPKDLLLGIIEEVGEFRNIIKWEQNPRKIKKAMLENIEEVKANSCDIDIDESIEQVIKGNEERFPIKKTKNRHTNIKLGGHDGKY